MTYQNNMQKKYANITVFTFVKIKKTKLLHSVSLIGLAMVSFPSTAGYINSLEIYQAFTEIYDTGASGTKSIPINTSGTANNTSTWTDKPSAKFLLQDTNNPSLTYGMTVTPTNYTTNVGPTVDSLMLVRTVNSQGLTDTGTLSLYVRPSTSGNWSMDLAFQFYTGTDFINPAPLQLLMTSYDIDFTQQMGFENSKLDSYYLASSTKLAVSTSDLNYLGYTKFYDPGNTNSATNDSKNAFGVITKQGTSSFTVRARHNSVALYEFEFRDPPENLNNPFPTLPGNIYPVPDPSTPIPEPLTIILISSGLAWMFTRRKKFS